MTPTTANKLEAGHIHAWTLDLASLPDHEWPNTTWLTEDERARAAGSGNPLVRRRFIQVRSALRWLLGMYLTMPPADIRIALGPHGKPELAGSRSGLAFNLSHSGNFALFAFALNRRLGVDVEIMHPRRNLSALSARILAPGELAVWQQSNAEEQEPLFYRWWVCKEAFGKAVGLGLQVGFTNCSVDPLIPRLLEIPGVYGPLSLWNLVYLPIARHVAAGLCYTGSPAVIEHAELSPKFLSP